MEIEKTGSKLLNLKFGKGFDKYNLRNKQQYFHAFPIRDAMRHELVKRKQSIPVGLISPSSNLERSAYRFEPNQKGKQSA